MAEDSVVGWAVLVVLSYGGLLSAMLKAAGEKDRERADDLYER